jgi:hypothetical protein
LNPGSAPVPIGNKVNKIFEFKRKIEGENKSLKEQISSMPIKVEIGQ